MSREGAAEKLLRKAAQQAEGGADGTHEQG